MWFCTHVVSSEYGIQHLRKTPRENTICKISNYTWPTILQSVHESSNTKERRLVVEIVRPTQYIKLISDRSMVEDDHKIRT